MRKPFYTPFVTVSTVLAVSTTIPAFGNVITVSEEKTTRAFIIAQFTEITVNGQRATIVDLKPGMTVSVTIGTDPTRASRSLSDRRSSGRESKEELKML
jgi:hypothetical protein